MRGGRAGSLGRGTRLLEDNGPDVLDFREAVLVHSFIHYGDLYRAPSRLGLLLGSAPDPCTAKEKSFEARVKCVTKNPENNLFNKNPSPFHGEGPTTENARAWVVDVRAKGTKSNPCSDERSELRPLVPGAGQQRSRR